MRFNALVTASASLLLSQQVAAVDDWMGCNYRDFCSRHRDYILSELETPSADAVYSLDVGTIAFDAEKITATLLRASHADPIADELQFNFWLYQDGIARVTIDEPWSGRFRISQ